MYTITVQNTITGTWFTYNTYTTLAEARRIAHTLQQYGRGTHVAQGA